MQTQKLIIIAIAVLGVLLVGVVGVGIWLRMQAAPETPGTNNPLGSGGTNEPSTNTPGGTNTPVGGTSTTTTGGTQTGGTNTTTTIPVGQSEFSKLFSSLGITKLTLQLVGTTEGQFGAVYALYAGDLAVAKKMQPNAAGYPIHVAAADLGGDSASEVVVFEDMPGLCGSGGCSIEVFKKDGSSYVPILSTLGYEFIGTGSTKTGGYADLYIAMHGSGFGYMTRLVKYAWNGSKYVPGAAVAVWDGDSFELVK